MPDPIPRTAPQDAPGCPQCGAPPAASLGGLCPRCLVDAVFADPGVAEPESEDLAGAFPGFEVRRAVGSGGMGAVYEAWEYALERRVALKLLPQELLRQADFFDRFQREARLMAQLDHPNVARVFGSGVTDAGQAYIAIEFIEGVALTEHADSRNAHAAERISLFLQVAAGMEHAHQKGVVHRDLKPSNILVTAEGLVKVIDFGLARGLAQPGDTTALWRSREASPGTPGYMSPEQCAGEVSDTRADVFSLGVVLDELLRRQAPAASQTTRAEWQAIVARAIAPDPAARYPNVHALAEDLRRHLNHRAVEAMPATTGYRLRKYVRRHRLGLALAAAGALLVFAVVAAIVRESIRAHAAERLASERLRGGERLIEFMLDDLHDRLKPVGSLDILETTTAKVEEFYATSEEGDHPASVRHRARPNPGRAGESRARTGPRGIDPALRTGADPRARTERLGGRVGPSLEFAGSPAPWRCPLAGGRSRLRPRARNQRPRAGPPTRGVGMARPPGVPTPQRRIAALTPGKPRGSGGVLCRSDDDLGATPLGAARRYGMA